MPTKQWKRNGPEQQHLENLFKTGEISVEDQAKDVYEAYASFQDFSRETFRKKFVATRQDFINSQPTTVKSAKNNQPWDVRKFVRNNCALVSPML